MKELTLQELKTIEFDILKMFDTFCRENNIRYFLVQIYLQEIFGIPLELLRKPIIRQISSCFFCERLDFVIPRRISIESPFTKRLLLIPSASLIM